jgi:hypothetical protein
MVGTAGLIRFSLASALLVLATSRAAVADETCETLGDYEGPSDGFSASSSHPIRTER